MKYKNVEEAIFVDRPNRFIAHVDIGGVIQTVHVKNTGRCKELLIPGVKVFLEKSSNPARKTAYDLIVVHKAGRGLINIDSQAPNQVAGEWLSKQDYDLVKPEYTYKNSRIDFYMEKGKERYLMEIKGCTLEIEGIGFFPDAPTERGVKHLKELARAAKEGYNCSIGFVVQINGVREVRANIDMHPEFGQALDEARAAGVKVIFLLCEVEKDSLEVVESVVAR